MIFSRVFKTTFLIYFKETVLIIFNSITLKDLTLQNPPIKRNVRKNMKQRDSFINDQTSSESEHESLYYTALTNPRVSTNSTQSKPAVPGVVQR